jgi:hypothetical protein
VLTGLIAGLVITLVVVSVVWLINHRRIAIVTRSIRADQTPLGAPRPTEEPVDLRKVA